MYYILSIIFILIYISDQIYCFSVKFFLIFVKFYCFVEFLNHFRYTTDDRSDHGYNEAFQIADVDKRLSSKRTAFNRYYKIN